MINWPAIKVRYEAGETPYSISKALGGTPSKQGIVKRAKKEGWGTEGNSEWLSVAERLPITQDSRRELATPQILGTVLEYISMGAPEYLAAQAAGISRDSLGRYKAECPELAEQIKSAKAMRAIERIKRIEKAGERGDWKADQFLLEKDETTREQFSGKDKGGMNIILNIQRESVTVDGEVIDGQ